MSLPPLVLAAHGSPHPDHAPSILLLRDAIGRRGDVTVGWLDYGEPDLVGAVALARRTSNGRQNPAELRMRRHGPVIVVPLLLAAGYHARVDIPRMLAHARSVLVAATLGPDPLLAEAVARRLSDVGTPKEDPVVLAAAGSSDDYAVAQIESVAEALRALRPGPVRAAYLSGKGPPVGDVVRELAATGEPVTVATYLLSPGTLADTIAEAAREAGAPKVTAPLGLAPEVITLIRERWLAASPDKSSP